MTSAGTLDSALLQLAAISPEYADALSDHTPMVVDALDRLGEAESIPRFLAKTLPKRRAWGSIEEPTPGDGARAVA